MLYGQDADALELSAQSTVVNPLQYFDCNVYSLCLFIQTIFNSTKQQTPTLSCHFGSIWWSSVPASVIIKHTYRHLRVRLDLAARYHYETHLFQDLFRQNKISRSSSTLPHYPKLLYLILPLLVILVAYKHVDLALGNVISNQIRRHRHAAPFMHMLTSSSSL